jgi:hypothetical protein
MNDHQNSDDLHSLDPPLLTAVQDVLAEPLPEEAISRVLDRAKRLKVSLSDRPSTANETAPTIHKRSSWWLAKSASGATAMAAALLLAVFLFSDRASVSWAEMLAAVASRPWVHATTTYSDGEHHSTSESWVSNADRSAAFKLGDLRQFDDIEKGFSLQYDAKEGTIYRVPSLRLGLGLTTEIPLPGLLNSLIADKTASRDLFYGDRVIKAERHVEEHDGKQWLVYLIHLEQINNASLDWTVRIRLDQATQLPEVWEERRANGVVTVTRFDYPDNGPRNIYELGVPKIAKLIDRVPKGDLARIVASQRADRKRFDAYDAIVVQHTDGVTTNYDNLLNLSVKRVRRKDRQYRVDQLLTAKPGLTLPPPGTDMQQWWKENRDRYWSVPQLICDGETTRFYKMQVDELTPGQNPNLSVVEEKHVPIRLPLDDSPVEWPHLMPEQCSRPHLGTSDKTIDFDVDSKSHDGPPDTVRVVVTKKSGPRSGELFRYWFDPARDDVLRKETSAVFDHRTNKLDFLDTQEYDEFAQSPSGKWYPQRIRRTTSDNPQWQGVTRFHLDFETAISDDLFKPIAEK